MPGWVLAGGFLLKPGFHGEAAFPKPAHASCLLWHYMACQSQWGWLEQAGGGGRCSGGVYVTQNSGGALWGIWPVA